MPTPGERIAVLEEQGRDHTRRIEWLEDNYNGGGDIQYDRSVRGRLHKLETVAASAVLRRNYGVGLLKGWERSVLVLCAVGTVAAAWYGALH